jgi:hypothetical protein
VRVLVAVILHIADTVACMHAHTLQALNIVVYDLLSSSSSSSSSASHRHRDKSYYFKAALSNDAPGHVAHPPADVVADVAVGVSLITDSTNSGSSSSVAAAAAAAAVAAGVGSSAEQLSIEVPPAGLHEEVLSSAYGDPMASHSRANSDAPEAAVATSTYAGNGDFTLKRR